MILFLLEAPSNVLLCALFSRLSTCWYHHRYESQHTSANYQANQPFSEVPHLDILTDEPDVLTGELVLLGP